MFSPSLFPRSSLCFIPLSPQSIMSPCLFIPSPSVKFTCLSLSLGVCVCDFLFILVVSCLVCTVFLPLSQILFSRVAQVCPLRGILLLCIYSLHLPLFSVVLSPQAVCSCVYTGFLVSALLNCFGFELIRFFSSPLCL